MKTNSKMSTNEILLDTNVVRRILENNANMYNVLDSMKKDGYKFAVTDMSLFELLTSKNIETNIIKLLTFLCDYEIAPIYKQQVIPKFKDQYIQWFKKESEIIELKRQLFPSFSYTLSSFFATFTNAIMIFIANKLTNDYDSEFYRYLLSVISFEQTREHYVNILNDSYILNKEKFRRRILLELKDLVLREITYYNLLQNKVVFSEHEFRNEFAIQEDIYKNQSFKDICSSMLGENDIKIIPGTNLRNASNRNKDGLYL